MSLGASPNFDWLPSPQSAKPRVFVSYHHVNDQWSYNLFSQTFAATFDIITDTSLERNIDSDDPDYVRRAIREGNITGSSVTIVLCGAETWKRRWIDWEIQMTLSKCHGLLGIILVTCLKNALRQWCVPARLDDNINSGYAVWMEWPATAPSLQAAIYEARKRAMTTTAIRNERPAMQRSLA